LGRASRLNPRASGVEDVRALARLQAMAAALTRVSFERCLLSYPPEHRAEVRAVLQPGCPWTVENRRARRIAQEAAMQTRKARARLVVVTRDA
jgi:hypothetical protein